MRVLVIQVRDNLPIHIDYHPYHQSLNEKILKESIEYDWQDTVELKAGGLSNVKARQTVEPKLNSKSLDVIYDWVLSILRGVHKYGGWSYKVYSSWMARYNRGDYTKKHDHMPMFAAFVYFVKTPRGSSPLVFTTSGKRIKAEEGKVIIFPGHMQHEVPKNRCDDRIVLSGNIIPIFDED